MAQATGFQFDKSTGNVHMNAGDTGSFWVCCKRDSGEDWPSTARMLFTVKNGNGQIVMQRIYRPDDQWDQGDGVMLIEFHNDDTDTWDAGDYTMERRYDIAPIWSELPAPTSRCVNALQDGIPHMVEGDVVRTVFVGTLKIDGVLGTI